MEPAQKLKTTSVLSPLTPVETLRLLAQHANSVTQGHARNVPKVTLYLAGASFIGFVAGIRDDADMSYLLFVEHDDNVKGSINTIYLPMWSIVGVKVHDADEYLHLLSGGKIAAQLVVPNIMELRKRISDEVGRLRATMQININLEVSWETLGQDDLTLVGLMELIENSMYVIHQALTDEFKRIMFKSFIGAIRFQNATEAEVMLDNRVLVVRADIRARDKGRFSREEFNDALNSILTPVQQ